MTNLESNSLVGMEEHGIRDSNARLSETKFREGVGTKKARKPHARSVGSAAL